MIFHLFHFFLIMLLIDEVEDVEAELGHPPMEHLILSPPIFIFVIESVVMSKDPVVLVGLLLKFPADLDGHQTGRLILNRGH